MTLQCAEDERTRQLVRQHGGLDPLVTLAKDPELRTDKSLLAAVTGAIWKCAISPENVRRLDELFTVRILVQLLEDEHEEVSNIPLSSGGHHPGSLWLVSAFPFPLSQI